MNFFSTVSLVAVLLCFIVCSSSAGVVHALSDRVQRPPSFVNATSREENMLWAADWMIVGSSALAAFSQLSFGATTMLAVQRFRGLRALISRQCTMRDSFMMLRARPSFTKLVNGTRTKFFISSGASGAAGNSILDRADTPTGFPIGDGDERYIVGAFWANLVLGVVVIFVTYITSYVLEVCLLKPREEASGFRRHAAEDDDSESFLTVPAKWQLGRVLSGIVCLPVLSAFRLAAITLAATNDDYFSDVPGDVRTHAIAALAVTLLFLVLWSIAAPAYAVEKAAFVTDKADSQLREMDASCMTYFCDDTKSWKFEEGQHKRAGSLIAICSVDNFAATKWWFWLFLEGVLTCWLQLLPSAVASYFSGADEQCYANALTGLGITALFGLLLAVCRPFQRRLVHYFLCVQILTLLAAYLSSVLLYAPSLSHLSGSETAQTYCMYVAIFFTGFGSWVYLLLPLFKRLAARCCSSSNKDGDGNGAGAVPDWQTEFLSMLMVGGGGGRGGAGGGRGRGSNNVRGRGSSRGGGGGGGGDLLGPRSGDMLHSESLALPSGDPEYDQNTPLFVAGGNEDDGDAEELEELFKTTFQGKR